MKSPYCKDSLHNTTATEKVEEEEACAYASKGEGKRCATKEDFSGIQLITKRSQLEVRDGPTNEQEEPEKSTETGALGGYDYKLMDEKLQDEVEFKCQKCSLIPRVPIRVRCCEGGLVICQSCITSKCLNCHEYLQWQADEALQQQISTLQVYCVNREKGCQWKGQLTVWKNTLTRQAGERGASTNSPRAKNVTHR